jgi:hypothetical protein
MTGLSLGTVILSLIEGPFGDVDNNPRNRGWLLIHPGDGIGGCPSTTWHILEIIVNGGMVLEVGTRWVGFGKVNMTSMYCQVET